MKLARVLLLLPAILYVMITISWQQQGVNQITGDEPHYLLTADSILRDGDLLVVNNHQIDTPVLRCMPPGSRFGDDTHSLNGYSIHGLGLPLLLLPAYALGGVLGAKIWLAGLLGLIPISVYRRARALLPGSRWPMPIALLVGLSPPFLIGSNQLYPDLLAGLIIFTLLGGWGERRGSWRALGAGLLLALLPWLHLKFALPALLLGALYALWSAPSSSRPRLAAAVPLLVSLVGLGGYNQVAFGSPFGPYQAGDAAASLPQVLMVALGLHLDRMQGLFFQAPLLLLGVLGLAALLAESRRLALAGGAIYLALLLPSAAHTNWYGGASFAGRFFWALALLWVLPLLALLRRLRRPGQLAAVIGALLLACALEGIFLAKVLIPNSYTYTAPLHPTASWMDSDPYADYFDLSAIQRARWLPSFQDVDSFAFAPANWISWGMLLCLASSGRYLLGGRRRAVLAVWGGGVVAALILVGLLPVPIRPATLPHELALRRGAHSLGAGPHDVIQPGTYAVSLDYAAVTAPSWECALVRADGRRQVLAAGRLPAGQQSGQLRLVCAIPRASDRASLFEVRLYAAGGPIQLRQAAIQPLDLKYFIISRNIIILST